MTGDEQVSELINRALNSPRSLETSARFAAEAERLLDREDLSPNSRAFLLGFTAKDRG